MLKIKQCCFSAKNIICPYNIAEHHILNICTHSAHSLIHICTHGAGLLLGVNSGCLLAAMKGIMMWLWTALPFLMMQTNCDDTHFFCNGTVNLLSTICWDLTALQQNRPTPTFPIFLSFSKKMLCSSPKTNMPLLCWTASMIFIEWALICLSWHNAVLNVPKDHSSVF